MWALVLPDEARLEGEWILHGSPMELPQSQIKHNIHPGGHRLATSDPECTRARAFRDHAGRRPTRSFPYLALLRGNTK